MRIQGPTATYSNGLSTKLSTKFHEFARPKIWVFKPTKMDKRRNDPFFTGFSDKSKYFKAEC